MGPLGSFTKHLAQQAIGNQVKDVVDSLRPGESSGDRPAVPPDLTSALLGQLQAMQKALKEDEELAVFCTVGTETIRVFDIFVPSPGVVVLGGSDPDKNTTRIITPVETLQLLCKPRSVPANAKPSRVRFITPRPKQE